MVQTMPSPSSVAVSYRSALEQIVREQAQPAHKFGHQPRLYALCCSIGAQISYDDDVVFAAVWLHDVGVFAGNRPSTLEQLTSWDHVRYAVEQGEQLLTATDFPKKKIREVVRVIREHQVQNEPTCIESVIVRDADILEQLGAIGILRTAAKLGSDSRFLTLSDAAAHLKRIFHLLPEQLILQSSKRLAEEKVRLHSDFLDAIRAEGLPELY